MSSPSSASSLTDTEMQDASASTANQSSSQSQQQHFGTYSEQVSKRRALYNDVKPISLASTTFEPLLAVPHGCSVNTIAITPCSTHFFTGGADGLVRRFALIDSLNGRAVENLMVSGRPTSLNPSQSITNYIGDIPSSKPQAQVILSGYWESGSEPEEPNAAPIENGGDPSATTKFGPRGAGLGSVASPVHSIAVQDEEIFALVGTEVRLFSQSHCAIPEAQDAIRMAILVYIPSD